MKKVYCLNENDERLKNGSKVPVQKRYRRVRKPINEEECNNEDNFEHDEIDESFEEFKNRKGYLYEKFFKNVRPGASVEDFMDDEEDETPVRREKRRYAKEDNFQFNRGKIEQTSPFILGIAAAKVGEKYTFIDKTGRLLCGLYDYIEVDPKQRDAKIVYRGKTFYIDLMATKPEILRDDLRKIKKRFGINESLKRIDGSKSAKRMLNEEGLPYHKHIMHSVTRGREPKFDVEKIVKIYDFCRFLPILYFINKGRLNPKVANEIDNATKTLLKYLLLDKEGKNKIVDALINAFKEDAIVKDYSIPMHKRYAGTGYKFADDEEEMHSPDEEMYHDTYDAGNDAY